MLMKIVLFMIGILYAVYVYKIVSFLNHAFNKYFVYFTQDEKNVDLKYRPFHRYIKKDSLPKLEIYFCAIILAPFRIFNVIIILATQWLLVHVIFMGYDKKYIDVVDISNNRRKFLIFVERLGLRLIMWNFGFYWISEKNVKIADFDKEYKGVKPQNFTRAPIHVSNHVCHADIFYNASKSGCSFLSKAALKKVPFIGTLAQSIASIFVERENRDNKNNVLDAIQQRVDNIMVHKKNSPPLHIFVEGTTSNGKYLIRFKPGAFFTFSPINIFCLKYREDKFSIANDCLEDIYTFLFSFFQLKRDLTVYVFDTFFPDYLNLDKLKETDQLIYIEKVRNVMAKCMQVEKIETGFTESKEYYKIVHDKIKEDKITTKQKQN